MTITNFTVRFTRSVQPASYEKAEATVELVGIIGDGEDAGRLTSAALSKARSQALVAVGIKVQADAEALAALTAVDPVGTAEVLQSGEPDAENSDILVSAAVVEYAEQNQVDVAYVPGTGKNGRITKGDVNRFLDTKEAEAATAEATGHEVVTPDDDTLIPDDDEEIKTTYTAVEIPDDDGPEVSYEDLQKAAGAAAQKVGGDVVRKYVSGTLKIAFLKDLPKEQVAGVIARFDRAAKGDATWADE